MAEHALTECECRLKTLSYLLINKIKGGYKNGWRESHGGHGLMLQMYLNFVLIPKCRWLNKLYISCMIIFYTTTVLVLLLQCLSNILETIEDNKIR